MRTQSHSQYASLSEAYTHPNRSSQPVIHQLSDTSRQHLQQFSSKPQYNSSLPPPYNAERPQASHYSRPLATAHPREQFEVQQSSKKKQQANENEALRDQLQTQRAKYESHIAKLNQHIDMKDQLLDQCEKQLGNLKTTYQTLFSQFQQTKNSNNHKEQKIPSPTPQQQPLKPKDFNRGETQIKWDGDKGLVPLSVVVKGQVGSKSVGRLDSRKLTHGLIRAKE